MSSNAAEALKLGKLDEALGLLQNQVRQDPANAKHRVFLFQMLTVFGQWDRARTQLSVAAELDAANLAMAQAYREAIRCEALRAEVFSGKRSPLLFGEPEPWVALLMEALRLTADGKYSQSQEVRASAFEAAPTTSGQIITGEDDASSSHFQWIADADPRLGPVLEAMVNGRYYWIPFARIQKIYVEKPADLRDLVWMPAHFLWSNGGDAVGMIPTRYPGSESSEDDSVRMARRTEWMEAGEDLFLGLGQRVVATDVGEFPLMEVRQIHLDTGDEAKGAVPQSPDA